MKFKFFSDDWIGTRRENNFLHVVVLLSLAANLGLVYNTVARDEQVIIVPQGLSESVKLSKRQGDAAYKKQWAWSTATLLGNITPGNADFVYSQLSDILAPRDYQLVKDSLASQVTDIKANGVSFDFEAREVIYDAAIDKVFVVGISQTFSSAGRMERKNRIYEMRVSTSYGRPLLSDISTYFDVPHTKEWLDRQKTVKNGT